jgi:hypothetical protein
LLNKNTLIFCGYGDECVYKKINMTKFLQCIFFASITGCSGIPIKGKDGSVHHVIIGIGVVSTPKNNGDYGVLATKSQVIGIHLSDQPGVKLGAGYSSSVVVTVPDDSQNVVVEASQNPLGKLSITSNAQKEGNVNEQKDNKSGN